MHRHLLTVQARAQVLAITLALSSSVGLADEAPQDAKLTAVVRATLTERWQRNLSSDEKSGPLSADRGEVRAQIEKASQQAVSCFRSYTKDYDQADIQTFETLLSQYADAFEIPDWEVRLAKVIDARYGAGASLSRNSCSNVDATSRECAIAKSYGAVGGVLYWKFAHCAVESAKTIAGNVAR
ncbi:hypothetical protein KAK07_01485 [Ideonella sp. 4Y16]|uniref:hypothetical protein n=1 Tax=Ideonella alba TaxID=2824118 RepID=UPI001B372B5A|nr:hypothetical protein [Ideonella alba]MBQ0941998.1 hypothetical protein [Ideonella alba]